MEIFASVRLRVATNRKSSTRIGSGAFNFPTTRTDFGYIAGRFILGECSSITINDLNPFKLSNKIDPPIFPTELAISDNGQTKILLLIDNVCDCSVFHRA
jgi:hypothetical protein